MRTDPVHSNPSLALGVFDDKGLTVESQFAGKIISPSEPIMINLGCDSASLKNIMRSDLKASQSESSLASALGLPVLALDVGRSAWIPAFSLDPRLPCENGVADFLL
jgi:hypothetical protein